MNHRAMKFFLVSVLAVALLVNLVHADVDYVEGVSACEPSYDEP